MKKRILILTLLALPMLAMAQNKAIVQLADKYSDREGFSVITLQGKMTNVATKEFDMGGVEISSLMDNISSLIVISSKQPSEEFRADVRSAVARGDYSTLMTVSEDGQTIKFLLSATEKGGRGGSSRNEFVMMIFAEDEDTLVSIVGNYKVKQVSKTKAAEE
jgi:regulatory protein YycI of two-component signal transduction system YycFG